MCVSMCKTPPGLRWTPIMMWNISVRFISRAEPTSYDRHRRDYANDDVDDDDDDDYGAVPNVFL